MDSVDDDELEQEADEEVDKVLFELTDGKLGQAGRVGGELPVSNSFLFGIVADEADNQKQKVDEDEDEAEAARMQKEMAELLSS